MWANLRDRNSKEAPILLKSLKLLKFHQVLTVNIGEKSQSASGRGKRNRTIMKYSRVFCFS